jgi:hypothetical protein
MSSAPTTGKNRPLAKSNPGFGSTAPKEIGIAKGVAQIL